MERNHQRYLVLLFFLLISVTSIRAQNRYLTKTVDVTIPTVLDLQITSGATLSFDFNIGTKLDNGIEVSNAVTLTYWSNKAWFVNIKAGSANFTGGQGVMPASVLLFKKNGTASYTALSDTPLSLTGTTGSKNARGTGTIGIDYKMNPGYFYEPATDYSLNIIYTISNL